MPTDQIFTQFSNKAEESFKHFQDELLKIRTGRAHASILDSVMVMAYGVKMPLKQLANVSAPEAQLIQISPFDSTNLQAISSAIRDDQSLGLNPVDDGVVIRINMPPLTTERRSAIVKQLGEKTEKCMISMRTARHDALKESETKKKDREISEDDFKRLEKRIDELMSQYKTKVESLARTKEEEIMKV